VGSLSLSLSSSSCATDFGRFFDFALENLFLSVPFDAEVWDGFEPVLPFHGCDGKLCFFFHERVMLFFIFLFFLAKARASPLFFPRKDRCWIFLLGGELKCEGFFPSFMRKMRDLVFLPMSVMRDFLQDTSLFPIISVVCFLSSSSFCRTAFSLPISNRSSLRILELYPFR